MSRLSPPPKSPSPSVPLSPLSTPPSPPQTPTVLKSPIRNKLIACLPPTGRLYHRSGDWLSVCHSEGQGLVLGTCTLFLRWKMGLQKIFSPITSILLSHYFSTSVTQPYIINSSPKFYKPRT